MDSPAKFADILHDVENGFTQLGPLPDDVKNQRCVLERVCNMDWSPFRGCLADRCLTDTNASVSNGRDHRLVHSMGRAQPEFLTRLVECVYRTCLGIG